MNQYTPEGILQREESARFSQAHFNYSHMLRAQGSRRSSLFSVAKDVLVFAKNKALLNERADEFTLQYPKESRFYVIEEASFGANIPELHIKKHKGKLNILSPILPKHFTTCQSDKSLMALLGEFMMLNKIRNYDLWYYTPLALSFTRHLIDDAQEIVYHCENRKSQSHLN